MGKQCYYCEKSHCKLDTCSTCDDEAILYCSKECQISSWWKIHKYTCSGGKYKFLEGCDVTIKNLESRPEFNGQVATVESFSKEEGTFDVNFEDLREDMKGLAPKNLDSNCKYSLVRINAKTLNPKDITHIEIFQNDFKKFHQNLNSLFHTVLLKNNVNSIFSIHFHSNPRPDLKSARKIGPETSSPQSICISYPFHVYYFSLL
jgi:hypothetical protein